MGKKVHLRLQDLEKLYNVPIEEAAKKLGVSRPTISRTLRKHGVGRWPYRKVRALMRKRKELGVGDEEEVGEEGEEGEEREEGFRKVVGMVRSAAKAKRGGKCVRRMKRGAKKKKVFVKTKDVLVDDCGEDGGEHVEGIVERSEEDEEDGGSGAVRFTSGLLRENVFGPSEVSPVRSGFVHVNNEAAFNRDYAAHRYRGRLFSPVAPSSPLRMTPFGNTSSRPSSAGRVVPTRRTPPSRDSMSPGDGHGYASRKRIVNGNGQIVGQRVHGRYYNRGAHQGHPRTGAKRVLRYGGGNTRYTDQDRPHHRQYSTGLPSSREHGLQNGSGLCDDRSQLTRGSPFRNPFQYTPTSNLSFSGGYEEEDPYGYNNSNNLDMNEEQDPVMSHNMIVSQEWKDSSEEDKEMYVWWPHCGFDGGKFDDHYIDCGNYYQHDRRCSCNDSPGKRLRRSESDPTLSTRGHM